MIGIEDTRCLSIFVHTCFIGFVSFKGTVPIDVIFGHVKHHGSVRRQRRSPVQLKARKLYRKKFIGFIVGNSVDCWHAHVPNLQRFFTGCFKNRIDHAHGRSFPIGSRQAQPLWSNPTLALIQTPCQFDFTPNLDTPFISIKHNQAIWTDSWRSHDNIRVLIIDTRHTFHVFLTK